MPCFMRLVFAAFAALLISAAFMPPSWAQAQNSTETPAAQPQPAAANGSAVKMDGTVLFYVQERVYSFSPQDRAQAVSQRIRKLALDPRTQADQISVQEEESTSDIVLGDTVIMAVTDRDARAAGQDRSALAQQLVLKIRAAIFEHQRSHGLQATLISILWAALATALMALALKLLKFGANRLYQKIDGWRGSHIRALRFQQVELLSADRIADALTTLARAVRIVLTLLLFYLYLPMVLSFFPWTRGWAGALLHYIAHPLQLVWGGLISYLPNLFFIAVILIIAHYVVRTMKFIFVEIAKGHIEITGFYRDWAIPTYKIARFLAVVFTAIVVFPYLPGSSSPAFKGISIFLGVLFSLGSTSAVANIIAGMVLTYTRAFQMGDRIKIGDTTGDVVEKTLLVTQVRTIKHALISVPNAMVLSSHIINYSASAKKNGLILNTEVTIGYDASWREVHRLLLAAAAEVPNTLTEPQPFVLQTRLGDFYVCYELNVYTREPQAMAQTYSLLHQNIQDRFAQAGIEIMSPHYNALRDGNTAALPAQALPSSYRAPAFRVESIADTLQPKRSGAAQI